MPEVSNPHKKFQWSIEILTLNPFLAQKTTTPDTEIDVVEHGETNHLIKTGGMVKYGNLMVEKISSASIDPLNNFIWDWIRRIQDPATGGGDIPDEYKYNIRVLKYATNGETIIGRWEMEGAWPCKINGVELSRVESDNTIESLEFCIDKMQYIPQ